jgi:hypothetical protein
MTTLLRATVVLLAALASVQAAAIQLQQPGWDQGGPLTVSFSGTDLDSSGAIEQHELDTFQAVFVLPMGGATVWMIADIRPDGFEFAGTDNFLLSLWNGQYLLNDEAFGGLTLGSVADMFLFPIAVTAADFTVIPETSTAALMPFVLAAIGYLVLRRRWNRLSRTSSVGTDGRGSVRGPMARPFMDK